MTEVEVARRLAPILARGLARLELVVERVADTPHTRGGPAFPVPGSAVGCGVGGPLGTRPGLDIPKRVGPPPGPGAHSSQETS